MSPIRRCLPFSVLLSCEVIRQGMRFRRSRDGCDGAAREEQERLGEARRFAVEVARIAGQQNHRRRRRSVLQIAERQFRGQADAVLPVNHRQNAVGLAVTDEHVKQPAASHPPEKLCGLIERPSAERPLRIAHDDPRLYPVGRLGLNRRQQQSVRHVVDRIAIKRRARPDRKFEIPKRRRPFFKRNDLPNDDVHVRDASGGDSADGEIRDQIVIAIGMQRVGCELHSLHFAPAVQVLML